MIQIVSDLVQNSEGSRQRRGKGMPPILLPEQVEHFTGDEKISDLSTVPQET